MILRLDERHKMNYVKGIWTLYKLGRVGPFNQEKFDKLSEPDYKGVKYIVIEDGKEKAFGAWKKIGTFETKEMTDAFFVWLHSKMDDKYGNKEVTVRNLKEFYSAVKKDLEILVASMNVFTVKLEVQMPDLEKLENILHTRKKPNIKKDKDTEIVKVENASSKRKKKDKKSKSKKFKLKED